MAGGLAGAVTVLVLKYLVHDYPFPTLGFGVSNVVGNALVMLRYYLSIPVLSIPVSRLLYLHHPFVFPRMSLLSVFLEAGFVRCLEMGVDCSSVVLWISQNVAEDEYQYNLQI